MGGEHWESMVPEANFNTHMNLYRFKDFCHFLPFAYKSQTLKNNNDPCWEFADAVTEFNNNRMSRLNLPSWLSSFISFDAELQREEISEDKAMQVVP